MRMMARERAAAARARPSDLQRVALRRRRRQLDSRRGLDVHGIVCSKPSPQPRGEAERTGDRTPIAKPFCSSKPSSAHAPMAGSAWCSGQVLLTAYPLKTTGFSGYDRPWRYQPFTKNGVPEPACTTVTF